MLYYLQYVLQNCKSGEIKKAQVSPFLNTCKHLIKKHAITFHFTKKRISFLDKVLKYCFPAKYNSLKNTFPFTLWTVRHCLFSKKINKRRGWEISDQTQHSRIVKWGLPVKLLSENYCEEKQTLVGYLLRKKPTDGMSTPRPNLIFWKDET